MTNPHTSTIKSDSSLPRVYIGLPMWQHPTWPSTWFAGKAKGQHQLVHYANALNCIEGNTSFYSLPNHDTLLKWKACVPSDFRFTFKFNQQISHHANLTHCDEVLEEQLAGLEQIKEVLGLVMLQLPAQFSPIDLPKLDQFLRGLPHWLTVAVEVRHLAFFAKGEEEKALNRMLIEHKVNRVIMDTRALFTGPNTCEVVAEVRQKKPRVPVNVIATASNPVVRFVGNDNSEDNQHCLLPWINKVHQWRCEGKAPYLFFHRPDNKDAPWLAQQFIEAYNSTYEEAKLTPLCLGSQPSQTTLF